jgi:hypothetical protein
MLHYHAAQASHTFVDDLFPKVGMYAATFIKIWLDELFKYFRKSLDEAVDEAKKKGMELRTKWKALLDEGSETAGKWRMDVGKLKVEVRAFVNRFSNDMHSNWVREVHARLGSVIDTAGWGCEQGSWFWRCLSCVH